MDLPGFATLRQFLSIFIHHTRPAQGGVMLGSGILDLAIGLAFVFGVTAALASVITELISRFLGLRGAYLLRGLRELLDGPGGATVVNEAGRDFAAMRDLVNGTIEGGTMAQVPTGPETQAAAVTPTAASAPAATTAPADTSEPTTDGAVKMQNISATGALLGGRILRSQGMTDEIFKRDLTVKPSRIGPGVTGGVWWKPRWGAKRSLPSYISAKSISGAVIDLLVPDAAGETTMSTIQKSLDRLPQDLPFTRSLRSLATNAANDITRFRASIESWYDDHMDRVSGWYKRHVAKITITVGAILVILLNINTITIGRTLYSNSVVGTAVSTVAAHNSTCQAGNKQCLATLQSDLAAATQAGLPIGWPTVSACLVKGASCNWLQQRGILNPKGSSGWQLVLVIIGFLLTVLALTPGAQFWFGLLVKLGAIRSTGPKPPTPAPATNTVVTLSPEVPPPLEADPQVAGNPPGR
jgi:hypothetical protein